MRGTSPRTTTERLCVNATGIGSGARSIVNVATGYHAPKAVSSLDKSVNCSGEAGISENGGVISRIDPVEAARLHKPAADPPPHFVRRRPRRSGNADDAQRRPGGNR